SRAAEFTTYAPLSVLCATWNVNAKKLDDASSDLSSWLFPDDSSPPPAVVAVGFQEIVDLNAVNVAVDSKASQRSSLWQETISRTLKTRGSYTLLASVHLVGMLLCVYVSAPHVAGVSNIHTSTAGVGVMGVLGNKGGVSVRFQLNDSTFCFVCAHFAAHRENVAGRNADFQSIVAKTAFEVGEEAVREGVKSGSLEQWSEGSTSIGLMDHDFVYWLGDLNYRIDEALATDDVLRMAAAGEVEELRAHDQLNIERFNERVFQGFEEGVIDFGPTYKYQPGTDAYETRPDKKLRAPAWCDRVLWCATHNPNHTKQLSYGRAELRISDHKPVYAAFEAQVKNIVVARRQEVYGEVMRTLDRYENQSLPKVDLNKTCVDLGLCYYENKATDKITLTNSGAVVAHFRLVPKLEESELCKPWITVSPTSGMLIPGESMAINFSVTVDNDTATKLNTGDEVLEDILILRLENGRDHYLTVSGKYARSCFGMSCTDLVLISVPVRDVPLATKERVEFEKVHLPAALSVPKELWRVVDAIYDKGLHEKDLFLTPGFGNELKQIRECLDTSSDFGGFHVHSMAEAFVTLLSNLSTPIVPSTLFPTLEIDQQNIQPWSRRFLEELPPIHYNVFVYVISFFREVLLFGQSNHLTAQKLARVCCNCLTNQAEAEKEKVGGKAQRSMAVIFLHFLTTQSI
ncbi:hypothetical protein TeGR_g5794, partial [Tetraparma gracilis]